MALTLSTEPRRARPAAPERLSPDVQPRPLPDKPCYTRSILHFLTLLESTLPKNCGSKLSRINTSGNQRICIKPKDFKLNRINTYRERYYKSPKINRSKKAGEGGTSKVRTGRMPDKSHVAEKVAWHSHFWLCASRKLDQMNAGKNAGATETAAFGFFPEPEIRPGGFLTL